MKYYLTYIRDVVGSNYIGVNIPDAIVDPFLDKLKSIEEDYDIFIGNQKRRDHDEYHITVINVGEYNKLSNEIGMREFVGSLELILKYEIDDLEMLGVGTAEKNGNRTYFIVCQSDKLDAVRTRFNLPKQDFHITIGFNAKDVFGVRKNEII